MATLKNTTVAGTGALLNVKGSAAQGTAGANGALQNGAFRYDTDVNETLYAQGTTQYNPIDRATYPRGYRRPRNIVSGGNYPGSSSSNLAASAEEVKYYYPDAPDGLYWINLPGVGAKQVFCVMNANWAGGGWMLAMKATRGGTFTFGSSYWTSVNTLNDNSSYWNQNDQDFKGEVFNRFPAKDLLARWPDLGNGGSLSIGNWSWYQPNFYNGQGRGSTYNGQVNGGGAPGFGQNGPQRGHRIELVNLFNRVSRYFIQDADTFHGGPAYGNFSSQSDIRFYGFNWNDNLNSRWGFGYNENGGGVYPYGNEGSDDLVGGIGTNYHSAGDQINCCQNRTGMNRNARIEVYVR
jgi:hypothetical protein